MILDALRKETHSICGKYSSGFESSDAISAFDEVDCMEIVAVNYGGTDYPTHQLCKDVGYYMR